MLGTSEGSWPGSCRLIPPWRIPFPAPNPSKGPRFGWFRGSRSYRGSGDMGCSGGGCQSPPDPPSQTRIPKTLHSGMPPLSSGSAALRSWCDRCHGRAFMSQTQREGTNRASECGSSLGSRGPSPIQSLLGWGELMPKLGILVSRLVLMKAEEEQLWGCCFPGVASHLQHGSWRPPALPVAPLASPALPTLMGLRELILGSHSAGTPYYGDN